MDCLFLKHGLLIANDGLYDCCYITSENQMLPLIKSFNKNDAFNLCSINWDEIFLLKKELKDIKINSEKYCKNCIFLNKNLDLNKDEEYISFLRIGYFNKCNSKCIYCSEEFNGGDKYFNGINLIKSLFEYKNGAYIRNLGDITFLGGEPTIIPEFEELIHLFMSKSFLIKIYSSGIAFSEAIYKHLSSGLVNVIISPDTAIKSTYKKIKRVDCFEKVWNNIEKYISVQKKSDNVCVKFIIIPRVNDSFEEINAFCQKVKTINVKKVIWDIEANFAKSNNYYSPHCKRLLEYAVSKSQEYGLDFEYFSIAETFMAKQNLYDKN